MLATNSKNFFKFSMEVKEFVLNLAIRILVFNLATD